LSCGHHQYKGSVNVPLRLLVLQGKAEKQEGVGKRLEAQNSKTNRKSWCKKMRLQSRLRIFCTLMCINQFPWLSASHQLHFCLNLLNGRLKVDFPVFLKK